MKCLLSLHGFDSHFVQLILDCISTPSFSVLLNGSSHGFFQASRGIRQGDPLSPALFTLLFDVLSRLLTKAKSEGHIHGIKVSRTSPSVSHFLYADDLNIYCKATVLEAKEIAQCLQLFCSWMGQTINLSKSSVHFSRNVCREEKQAILTTLGMVECGQDGLGIGLGE